MDKIYDQTNNIKVTSKLETSNQLGVTQVYGYKRLLAWQKANDLALLIYQLTKSFPKEELFGITSQLRRAALSVALNIVEGHARYNKKEFCRFLLISLGSLAETEYLIDFCYKQNLISSEQHNQISQIRQETGNLIWKLYQSQK